MAELTVYATSADLADWLTTDAPSNAETLLRSASILVARATRHNPYGDQPDASDVDALRDATSAQVAAWVALGVDPAALGTDVAPVKTVQLGTGTITRDTSAESAIVQAAIDDLAPEAAAILTAAGLLWAPVPLGASDDCLPHWGMEPLHEPLRWPYV